MPFIKESHDVLFQKHIQTLLDDIGRPIYVYKKNPDKISCTWCIQDPSSKKSSGKPAAGKVWNTHANYTSNFVCPECKGVFYLNANTVVTITKVIIQDISGEQYDKGKAFYFKPGTKRLYGKLSEILATPTDLNSECVLSDAIKIVIDNVDHKLVSINQLGIKDKYLFEAIVERMDVLE